MRFAALAVCAALAACSGGGRQGKSVDLDAAANRAESDIANYAAASPSPAPSAAPDGGMIAPAAAASPVPHPSASAADLTSPAAAADLVRRYYALIERGRYGDAWALWTDHGKAAGVSPDDFAKRFADYAALHAEVGAPFGEDAGAGQRFIQVPARLSGRLKSGEPFTARATLTLHRVAEGIDTSDPVDHLWRISRSDVKPIAPSLAPGQPPTVTAHYRCAGAPDFVVHFDNIADVARIEQGGKPLATLDGQRAASGIWYKGEGYELRGKGQAARFTRPSAAPVDCAATD